MQEQINDEPWYAVRCVFRLGERSEGEGVAYEERVTLWRAASFDDAIEHAERDAQVYAEMCGGEYLGLAQAFHLAAEGQPGDGDEVFSLIRVDRRSPEEYLSSFFDTGNEQQGKAE